MALPGGTGGTSHSPKPEKICKGLETAHGSASSVSKSVEYLNFVDLSTKVSEIF